MSDVSKKGYVITRQLDHKRSDYITCDYVEEHAAETKYNEIAQQLTFPQKLTCRAAWLKECGGFGRYWTERNESNDASIEDK